MQQSQIFTRYVARKKLIKNNFDKISFFGIGCSSYVELSKMDGRLKKMRENLPNVYPKILVKDYSVVSYLLKNRNIDLALVTRDMIKNIDCKFKVIKQIKTYAIFSNEYKIEGISLEDIESLSFEELKHECLITLALSMYLLSLETSYKKNLLFILSMGLVWFVIAI